MGKTIGRHCFKVSVALSFKCLLICKWCDCIVWLAFFTDGERSLGKPFIYYHPFDVSIAGTAVCLFGYIVDLKWWIPLTQAFSLGRKCTVIKTIHGPNNKLLISSRNWRYASFLIIFPSFWEQWRRNRFKIVKRLASYSYKIIIYN